MKISEYFNSTLTKSLATVDENGIPNVCLCGTAYMPDEQSIHIGVVFIERSHKNIQKTNKATFMATKPPNPDYWKQYEKTGEKSWSAGYRYYCTLIDETDNSEIIGPIFLRLRSNVGSRIADKIKTVMIFKIDNVRELDF